MLNVNNQNEKIIENMKILCYYNNVLEKHFHRTEVQTIII
nr:MAG TPA: hypothetical protein [Caudoviricetes sp.]